jgi:hypothetical protein
MFLTLVASSLLLTGCLTGHPVAESASTAGSQSQVLGSFEVESPSLGKQTLTATGCTSGDRQFFLGGDFTAQNSELVLRLVVDPLEGPGVRLFSASAPFDNSVVFRRSECRVFHFSLDTTGWRVNGVYDYRLTVDFDCSRAGETIRGKASTTHCH